MSGLPPPVALWNLRICGVPKVLPRLLPQPEPPLKAPPAELTLTQPKVAVPPVTVGFSVIVAVAVLLTFGAQASEVSDRAAIDRLFSPGWRMLGAEERIIDRYERPKSVWEVILEKAP